MLENINQRDRLGNLDTGGRRKLKLNLNKPDGLIYLAWVTDQWRNLA
jgi:hypothetical protein